MSTRAGRVSSSRRRQARPKRAEAGETSGRTGLGTGAGARARARRGSSCAASSAPPGFSIAPRRRPPHSPQGRGRGTVWGYSGCSYLTPLGGHGVRSRSGTCRHAESESRAWGPGKIVSCRVGKSTTGAEPESWGALPEHEVRCQRFRGTVWSCGAESADSPSSPRALIGRRGAGPIPGTRAAFKATPPAPDPGTPRHPRCGGRLRPWALQRVAALRPHLLGRHATGTAAPFSARSAQSLLMLCHRVLAPFGRQFLRL